MSEYLEVKVVGSPVTVRVVKIGDVGHVDTETNRIRVNGCWFTLTREWKLGLGTCISYFDRNDTSRMAIKVECRNII